MPPRWSIRRWRHAVIPRRALEDAGRNLGLTAIQGLLRLSLRLLSPVFPQSRCVVVSVFPETEGNGLEVARALVRRYRGKVVWLQDGHAPHADVLALVGDGMVLVEKSSLKALYHYLRAEAIFFTHGLYGSPKPSRRKPIVNLWHGDGPKQTRPDNDAGSLIPSTYLVGSTQLFSRFKAEAFEIAPQRVLVTGNPRTDQYWQPVDPDSLEQLGITGDFVVWMPTFRRTRAVGAVRRWSETSEPDLPEGRDEVPEDLVALVAGLRERGVQLVIKPHPMDADRRRWEGAITVSEGDLVRTGMSLYGLLGQSSGLVTDYSSVWVDYLLLDRPLAFLVPDRESYARKLVPADTLEWLPGEVVDHTCEPFGTFLSDLDANGSEGSSLRQAVGTRIGLNTTRSSAEDLITALEQRGVLTTRRPQQVAARP
ncbi:MAG: hypothetical protein JWR85_2830 [Marmoricola sp.]|nr:hypothetical protein [Marmoricola sp.]